MRPHHSQHLILSTFTTLAQAPTQTTTPNRLHRRPPHLTVAKPADVATPDALL